MKKIVLILLMLVLLCGCGSNKQTTQTQDISFSDTSYKTSENTLHDEVLEIIEEPHEEASPNKAREISENMSYDEVVETMGREPDEKIFVKDFIATEKENAINEFLEDAYNFLYPEDTTDENYLRNKELLRYYSSGYDYLEDVISDYYDRSFYGDCNSVSEFWRTTKTENHDDNWSKAATFVSWYFHEWYIKDHICTTYEAKLRNSVSDILSVYKNHNFDGFFCTWYDDLESDSPLSQITFYFDENGMSIPRDTPLSYN